MSQTPLQAKKDLIQNIVFGVSRSGAFQRNRIYNDTHNVKHSKEFSLFLKNELSRVLRKIISIKNYSEGDHYETIMSFVKDVSRANKHILRDGKITIGTAQKLINLYWKMSWLLQKNIPEPIHCPFDGIIIAGLSEKVKHIKWTKMDTIKDYKLLVCEAKVKSKRLSIAKWELIHYNVGNKIVTS